MDNDQDQVICQQCSTVPDNYVRLDCDHKFCLICLAYNYLQQHTDEHENTSICSRCSQTTQLDEETVQAIHYVIKEIIIPLIQTENEKEDPPQEEYELPRQTEPQLLSALEKQKQQYQQQQQYLLDLEEQAPPPPIQQQTQAPSFSLQPTPYQSIQNLVLPEKQPPPPKPPSNDRVQLYLERLDKSFKHKFEQVKELQEQKYQFSQRCKQTKDEIASQFQQVTQFLMAQQIQQLEQRKNLLLSDLNSLEMIQLLEIQKTENELEQQIQQMAKHQEELQKHLYKSKTSEEMNKDLIDLERLIAVSSPSLQIKTSLLNSQRQLSRLAMQATFGAAEAKNNREPTISTQEEAVTVQYNHSQTAEREKAPKIRFSPLKSQDRTADLWARFNESDQKSKLRESQIQVSNSKTRWKDTLMEIFDKKQDHIQQLQSSTGKSLRTFNIHQVLTMQQQSFMHQKELLLKR